MKVSLQVLGIVVAIVAAIAILAFALPHAVNPEARGVGQALNELPALYPVANQGLGKIVLKAYAEYRSNTAWWSGIYFSCLFGSALLSALAGVALKLESLQAWPRLRNDFAAVAAMTAALLVTLSTSGDFHRKWQANRIAASAMENLAYELLTLKNETERGAIIARIQAINLARNQGIVGEQAGAEPRGEAKPSGVKPAPVDQRGAAQ